MIMIRGVFFWLLLFTVFINKDVRAQQSAFQIGERIDFKVNYGMINAGHGSLSIKGTEEVGSKTTYHIVAKGKSAGFFDMFFKVRDTYQTFVDTSSLLPLKFTRDIEEGNYKVKQNVIFDQENKTAQSEDDTIDINPITQDLISFVYYLRSLDLSNIKKGDEVPITIYLDDELFETYFKYVGDQKIRTKFGRVNCMTFVPKMKTGRMFDEEEDLKVWITKDRLKLPVRIKSDLMVGSIRMDITGYENLVSEFNPK